MRNGWLEAKVGNVASSTLVFRVERKDGGSGTVEPSSSLWKVADIASLITAAVRELCPSMREKSEVSPCGGGFPDIRRTSSGSVRYWYERDVVRVAGMPGCS